MPTLCFFSDTFIPLKIWPNWVKHIINLSPLTLSVRISRMLVLEEVKPIIYLYFGVLFISSILMTNLVVNKFNRVINKKSLSSFKN